MSVAIIAGLGNPGDRYEGSRHNIGFAVLDVFASRAAVTWHKDKRFEALICKIIYDSRLLYLVKPQTFMNASGRCLSKVCRYYNINLNDLVVVHDDINLELGRIKISASGGSSGHNGIDNIISHMGDKFLRYRVGIGGKAHPKMDLVDHVLGRFKEEESALLDKQTKEFIRALKLLIDKGAIYAMNLINQK